MKKVFYFLIISMGILFSTSSFLSTQSLTTEPHGLIQEGGKDSILLAKLWRRTALNLIGVDSADNNTWSYEQIDSAITFEYVNNVHIDEGRVYYSPDNKLKIYTFFAETCAAHCFSWEESYLVYDEILQYVEINRVDSIHLLDDGKYLILDHTVEWHNSGYVKVCKANVVSFETDSVMITSVKNNDENAFQVSAQSDFEGKVFEYDEKRKELSYTYSSYEFDEESGEDLLKNVNTGSYLYIKGKFVYQTNIDLESEE